MAVDPIFAKSSVISTLSRADGYVVIPEGKEGLEAGEEVEVLPLAKRYLATTISKERLSARSRP